VTVGLNPSCIAAAILVEGHRHCSHGGLRTTRRRVGDIGTLDSLAEAFVSRRQGTYQ
jgi:hypothetical protein